LKIFFHDLHMALKQTDLELIARQLRAALDLIEAELTPPDIPKEIVEEVQRKMEQRICLAWDHVIPEGDQVMRGLCETDYHTLMARVRRGQETETGLMIQGKLGPKGPRGRKAALDLAREAKLQVVAEDLEKFKKKRKKKAEPESEE
jgi:hypothetical protein